MIEREITPYLWLHPDAASISAPVSPVTFFGAEHGRGLRVGYLE
jgi:hypothetical protein